MTFTARLLRTSTVWNLWRGHHRTSGVIHGVPFRWVRGNDYVTDVLTSHQAHALVSHPGVLFEVVAADLPETVPVTIDALAEPEPVEPEPEPESEPVADTTPIAKPSAAEVMAARLAARTGRKNGG